VSLIRVTIKGGDTHLQAEYLQRVMERLSDPRNGLIKAANAAAGVWERNFREGGALVGGWKDLAQATVENRVRQGMPAGPVLIKYGALKYVTTDAFMEANGPSSWSRSDPYSDNVTRGRLDIRKGVAHLSASGWKTVHQTEGPNRPARPFWFVDANVMAASKSAVEKWITDEVLR